MTGIDAIAARVSSIEARLGELGVSTSRSSGGDFAGVLNSMGQGSSNAAGSGETGTQKFFGYVPAGTKIATVPGTQAYATAQAEAAAAAAAAREAAAREAAEAAAASAAAASARATARAEAAQAARAGRTTPSVSGASAAAGSAAANSAGASAAATAGASAAAAAAKTSAAAPVPSAGGLTGTQVVDTANKYLGVPYKWGGATAKGLDCSGLVQRTFLDHGIKLPRTARQLMGAGTEVPSLAQAKPGDLIITRGGKHVSIYMGDNKIIHAPFAGEVVKIQKNYSTDATIDTIRRIV